MRPHIFTHTHAEGVLHRTELQRAIVNGPLSRSKESALALAVRADAAAQVLPFILCACGCSTPHEAAAHGGRCWHCRLHRNLINSVMHATADGAAQPAVWHIGRLRCAGWPHAADADNSAS